MTFAVLWHAIRDYSYAIHSVVTDSPSFKGLVPASEAASRAKRANRKRDTAVELVLRREIWRMGLRYRKHAADVPGTPDLVFPGLRVAVFCDGDFWHGRNWDTLRPKLEQGSNAAYWPGKIARNRERDLATNAKLAAAGWRVLRLWETDIRRHPQSAATTVLRFVDERKRELRGVARQASSGQVN
ncbi:MAG TPA: very short patch repair endonuclease [Chloroflexota bacterium]